MSWRQDTIVHCREAIARLRHGIEMMHAGTFEVRELDHGRWVMINHGCIEQDKKTIENLEEIIARAEEAELNESLTPPRS